MFGDRANYLGDENPEGRSEGQPGQAKPTSGDDAGRASTLGGGEDRGTTPGDPGRGEPNVRGDQKRSDAAAGAPKAE
jgi:hypothetical protein